MATGNDISSLLADPQLKVDPDWAIGMINACPAFVLPAALLLQRNPEDVDDETRKRLQAIVLLGAPDRPAMSDLANITGCDWADFYPPMAPPEQKSTVDTIDDFLQTYGHTSAEEDALLEKLIFNPVAADYFKGVDDAPLPDEQIETLAASQEQSQTPLPEPAPAEKEQPAEEKIESEAEKAEPEAEKEPEVEIIDTAPAQKATEVMPEGENDPEEPLLMESLAKIFIKQHRYGRAFEIINTLSLKYPEKSVYFADQLRFLQILMINEDKKANI